MVSWEKSYESQSICLFGGLLPALTTPLHSWMGRDLIGKVGLTLPSQSRDSFNVSPLSTETRSNVLISLLNCVLQFRNNRDFWMRWFSATHLCSYICNSKMDSASACQASLRPRWKLLLWEYCSTGSHSSAREIQSCSTKISVLSQDLLDNMDTAHPNYAGLHFRYGCGQLDPPQRAIQRPSLLNQLEGYIILYPANNAPKSGIWMSHALIYRLRCNLPAQLIPFAKVYCHSSGRPSADAKGWDSSTNDAAICGQGGPCFYLIAWQWVA